MLQPCLNIPFYGQRPEICPAETLIPYMTATKYLRTEDNAQLFISFKRPHRVVGSRSISRWIKETLTESGIDTTIFSAHSTRRAATSAARRVYIDMIRKTAGCSGHSKVCSKLYNRNVVTEDPTDFAVPI